MLRTHSIESHLVDYSLDDTSGDTSLSHFSINTVPADIFTVLADIKAINQYLKVLITPWSPVGVYIASS